MIFVRSGKVINICYFCKLFNTTPWNHSQLKQFITGVGNTKDNNNIYQHCQGLESTDTGYGGWKMTIIKWEDET